MAGNPMDAITGIAQALQAQQTGQPPPAVGPSAFQQLQELRKQRAPMGTQIGGDNTGGRHDPRRGMVMGNTAGPQRELMPPSRGRTMTAKQGSTDEALMNQVHDSMGGVDVSGLNNPQALLTAGVKAVTNLTTGQRNPADTKAAQDLVHAVQSGIIPASPEINKLIDAMKRGGLLNQSNIPTF